MTLLKLICGMFAHTARNFLDLLECGGHFYLLVKLEAGLLPTCPSTEWPTMPAGRMVQGASTGRTDAVSLSYKFSKKLSAQGSCYGRSSLSTKGCLWVDREDGVSSSLWSPKGPPGTR